jgi:hypothetical protein
MVFIIYKKNTGGGGKYAVFYFTGKRKNIFFIFMM